jgi:orotate phosphoribosyltransferase-like protein
MKNNDIAEVSILIRRDFNLGNEELVQQTTMDELKVRLTQIVTYLLDKDFEKFLHAMYRMDINEEKLKVALASDPPEQVAPNVAQLIIQRELQKVETRRKYS